MRATPAFLAGVMLVGCTSGGSGESTPSGGSRSGVTTAPSTTTSAPVDVSMLRGRVVVSDETSDVWVMDADGTRARQLTHSPAQEFDPTWSPDGDRVAYRHQTGDDSTTEIYVVNADGSHPRRLTHNRVADWGPDWSPDGRSIVWNSAVGTGGIGFVGVTMDPDASDRRRLGGHYIEYPAWSPDGSRIAFMAQEPGASGSNPDYNIFVMDADGSNVRRLTTAPGEDGWPAWAPDGSTIVFSSARDDCAVSSAADCRSTGDIGPWEDAWIMDADGSNQRRLTADFAQFFAWSPDGRTIMVAGASSLLVIRPDGTGMANLQVEGIGHPLFPDWIR